MKQIIKILKITGGVFLAMITLTVLLLFFLSLRPIVPTDYVDTIQTGAELEALYLAYGSSEVSHWEASAPDPMEKYEIFYPADLEETDAQYPAVVVVNGSGATAAKTSTLFEHLASWGFVVIGNEDTGTGTGETTGTMTAYLLELAQDPESIFYQKIDTDNIGITGHSQGGAGTLAAITVGETRQVYKAAVALSPTYPELADALGWHYEMDKVEIPLLMVAGTEGEFELETVIPPQILAEMYEDVTSPKVVMRRIGAEHAETLYAADGYVTAWFCWQLKDDETAAAVFCGEDPELLSNPLYQDSQIQL